MKDKRTYTHLKEHGEDMTHENESKTKLSDDRGPLDLTLLTEQYRTDLKKYQDRESLYINTENQLKGSKAIAIEMATQVAKFDRRNQELMKEIDRLNEEIQLLELKIKK
jgi:cell division protein FtsB